MSRRRIDTTPSVRVVYVFGDGLLLPVTVEETRDGWWRVYHSVPANQGLADVLTRTLYVEQLLADKNLNKVEGRLTKALGALTAEEWRQLIHYCKVNRSPVP